MASSITYSLLEIDHVTTQLLPYLSQYKIVAFHGEMGSGKTTFIKHLCEKLGAKQTARSPTFSLVNQYETADGNPIVHMDLYRLKDVDELLNIGFEDYFIDTKSFIFIEWPEIASDLLPDNIIHLYFETISANMRSITIHTP